MVYRGVKVVMDNHFLPIPMGKFLHKKQSAVRMESPTQICWFDTFTTCIYYIRQVYGFKHAKQ